MEYWPNNIQLREHSLKELESRQGILWIMKSETPSRVLESRVFFSTFEYAQIPEVATDLLHPLLIKARNIWDQNFSKFQQRLGLMV